MFASLKAIHKYLFDEIYDFTGELRTVNIANGNFHFAPLMHLEAALQNIDKMPQSTFDEIVEKNIARPFREGNGRSTRIWLDCILKKKSAKSLIGAMLIKRTISLQWNVAQLRISKLSIYSRLLLPTKPPTAPFI